MFDVGLGLRSLTQRSLRAQRNYRCRSVGRWPYYVPQTALRRVAKKCVPTSSRGCVTSKDMGLGWQSFNLCRGRVG
jgi:hypothetical protein